MVDADGVVTCQDPRSRADLDAPTYGDGDLDELAEGSEGAEGDLDDINDGDFLPDSDDENAQSDDPPNENCGGNIRPRVKQTDFKCTDVDVMPENEWVAECRGGEETFPVERHAGGAHIRPGTSEFVAKQACLNKLWDEGLLWCGGDSECGRCRGPPPPGGGKGEKRDCKTEDIDKQGPFPTKLRALADMLDAKAMFAPMKTREKALHKVRGRGKDAPKAVGDIYDIVRATLKFRNMEAMAKAMKLMNSKLRSPDIGWNIVPGTFKNRMCHPQCGGYMDIKFAVQLTGNSLPAHTAEVQLNTDAGLAAKSEQVRYNKDSTHALYEAYRVLACTMDESKVKEVCDVYRYCSMAIYAVSLLHKSSEKALEAQADIDSHPVCRGFQMLVEQQRNAIAAWKEIRTGEGNFLEEVQRWIEKDGQLVLADNAKCDYLEEGVSASIGSLNLAFCGIKEGTCSLPVTYDGPMLVKRGFLGPTSKYLMDKAKAVGRKLISGPASLVSSISSRFRGLFSSSNPNANERE